MKVLLKEDVENLGYAGEVYKVADGFGRNFLIPNGMAVTASPAMLKQAEVWRKKAEARRAEQRAEFEALAASIQAVRLTFVARAGGNGKLYGSITTAQVADALNEELGTDIDRRKVGVEPLRQLGNHDVVVRLSGEFQPTFVVAIESEDGEVVIEEPVTMEEMVEVVAVVEDDGVEIVAEEIVEVVSEEDVAD